MNTFQFIHPKYFEHQFTLLGLLFSIEKRCINEDFSFQVTSDCYKVPERKLGEGTVAIDIQTELNGDEVAALLSGFMLINEHLNEYSYELLACFSYVKDVFNNNIDVIGYFINDVSISDFNIHKENFISLILEKGRTARILNIIDRIKL